MTYQVKSMNSKKSYLLQKRQLIKLKPKRIII